MDPLQKSLHFMAGVNLDLDLTVVIQFVVVLVLMFVFKRLVFDPYLTTLDERDRKTVGTRTEADALRAEAEALVERYEASLADARATAVEAKRVLRAEGVDEKDRSLSAARKEATKTVEAAQTAIAAQVASERDEMDAQVDVLATMVVEKVIGRTV